MGWYKAGSPGYLLVFLVGFVLLSWAASWKGPRARPRRGGVAKEASNTRERGQEAPDAG